MEKIVFEKNDIRDYVKNVLQKKLRNLKTLLNLLRKQAVTSKNSEI
jgi:predicted RNA binding protein with dsRBD fold (UPF0201 family)